MTTLRDRCPLERRKILKKVVERVWSLLFIFIFVLIPISFVLSFQENNFFSIKLVLAIVLILLVIISLAKYIYEVFYMKHYFYDISKSNLIIKKGVFSRSEITLSFNRIQDVYVDQDFLDRMFGLYDVHVSSATFLSGALSHIDGLSKENSEIVKKLLLKEIGRK